MTVEELVLKISGDSKGGEDAANKVGEALKNAFESPQDALSRLGKSLADSLLSPLGATATAGAVLVGSVAGIGMALVEMAEKAAKVGAELSEMSETTGIAVEPLSALRGAAQIAGVDFQSLGNMIFMLEKRMGDASPAFEKGMKTLNINMADFEAMAPDQKLLALSTAFRALPEDTNKASVAFDLFGRQGRDAIPMLMKPMGDLVEQAKALGLTWSGEAAAGAEQFEMQSNALQAALQGVEMRIGQAVLPTLTKLVTALVSNKQLLADINVVAGAAGFVIGTLIDVFGKLSGQILSSSAQGEIFLSFVATLKQSIFETVLAMLQSLQQLPVPIPGLAGSIDTLKNAIAGSKEEAVAHAKAAGVLAASATALTTTTGALGGALKGLADQHASTSTETKQHSDATTKLTADQKAAQAAADALTESHFKLSAGVKAAADQLLAHGYTAEETFKILKDGGAVTDDAKKAIELLGEAHKQAAETEKKHQEALDALKAAQIPLTAAEQAHVKALLDQKLTVEQVAAALGLNVVQVRQYQDQLKETDKIAAMWEKTHEEMTAAANKFVEDGIAAIQKGNQKEADERAKSQTDQLQLMTEFRDKVNDMNLTGVDLEIVQINRARDAQIAAITKNADLTAWQVQQGIALINTYYDRQVDLANGSADTIEERMRKQGVFTQAELQQRADNARRDYEQMLADDGAFTDAEIRNAKRAADEAQAAADGTRTTWDKTYDALGDVSTILGSIPGKFSEIAQLAARTGQAIMKNLADGNVWGAVVAGITGAVQALGKLLNISTAGRDAVVTFANSFGGFDVLHDKLDALGASGEALWVKLTQGVDKADPAAAKAVIDEITKALGDQKQAEDALLQSQNQQLGDLLKGLDGLGAGDLLQPYLDKLADAKGLTGDNLALIKQLGGDGSVSFDQMQKAASALGISTDKLGQSFQNAKAQADWQSIIDNLDTLVRGGANLNDLLGDEGLQKKISDLVNSSIQFGTTIPENAKPWVQSLIDQGKLLDASGNKITDINKLNFGESLQTSMQKLIDKIGLLIDNISGVKDAIDKVPNEKDINFVGKKSGDWPTGDSGDGGDTVGAAATGAFVTAAGLVPLGFGLGGFVPRGTDTVPAMLTPGELVLNASQQGRLASMLAGGGGDGGLTVNFHEGAIDASGSMFTDTSGMRKLASVIGDEIARRYKQSYRVSTR